MGLAILASGLAIFLATHVFVTFRWARAGVIARLRLNGYRALFAVVSLAGLALMVWGYALYRQTSWIDLWFPPAWLRHVTVGLMWVSIVLLMAAYLPGHIKARVKHPMVAAIKIWAFAHLLANGDVGSVLLFGSFLGWAVYARIAAIRRETVEHIEAGPAPAGWTNDIAAVIVGTLMFLALGYAFHPVVIGVAVFGR